MIDPIDVINLYRERFPEIADLKSDKEFKELAESSVMTYLEKNREDVILSLRIVDKGIEENLSLLWEQVTLDQDKILEIFGSLWDMRTHYEQEFTTIAVLLTLRELYEYMYISSPAYLEVYNEERDAIIRIKNQEI